tara:strand:+ start:19 stop:594 length:576 start_codon:yes stop_codon:yes gene_type:complete
MARNITTAFKNRTNDQSIAPFYAVKLNFPSGAFLSNSSYQDLTINGEVYSKAGQLMNIQNVAETADIKAQGLKVIFSGLPTSIASASLQDNAQGTKAEVYFGFMTPASSGFTIVNSPYLVFEGEVDVMQFQESGDTATITFNIESKMVMLEKPIDRRYTDQDQKELFPNDKGLEFVVSLQDKKLTWGGGVT